MIKVEFTQNQADSLMRILEFAIKIMPVVPVMIPEARDWEERNLIEVEAILSAAGAKP